MSTSESGSSASFDFVGFLRRQWWIILGTAVVAALVAGLLSSGATTSYEAKSLIAVDSVTLGAFGRLARPDALIAIVDSAEFRAELAQRTGESEDALKSGLNAYTVGTPQTELWVAYSAASPDTAREIADEATVLLMEKQAEIAEPVVTQQREYVADAERLIAELQDSDNPDAPYQLWTVRRNLISDQRNLDFVENAYSPSGEPRESESTQRDALIRGALGGFAAGIVLGVIIAVIRESQYRRSASTPAEA